MAKLKAKIDYQTNTIILNNRKFNFNRYYPTGNVYNHVATFETSNNGEWFVPKFENLNKEIVVQPGIYRADNGRTTVKILTNEPQLPTKLPKLKLNVNNFETITPIPIYGDQIISKDDIRKVIRTEHLNRNEETALISTIYKNQTVLLKQNEKLSATTAIKHEIQTRDETPVYTKTYRYPYHFRGDVEDQIQEMLHSGIIQHSNSPYSAPIWVVPKKIDSSGTRKVRVVIDYRKLNEKTIDDKFPIPQIEEILDSLGKSIYFTTLDLKSGFHQIPMEKKSQIKTAFSTEKGHFEFCRMPFGLKNGPATFQRAMNNVLQGLIGRICHVYMDDIVIVGESLENHLENLNTVLTRLSEFNLKIQLDKCEFLKRETEFLGHVITQEGVKPNKDKIQKILDWPLPRNQKEIKQFLGLSGYYRRFIRDYSKIARNMTKYLKKDIPINLTDPEYVTAFDTLKKTIATDQILTYPDFSKPFILTTDASDYALGAVMSQIQNNIERPIAFASRTLNSTEVKYATNEKEALAIIWAVKKFKHYLYGNKFTLITDHKPLTFIKTSEKNSKILRWRLELENYDYDIVYREGRANVVADALSRMPRTDELNEVHINESTDNTSREHDRIPENPHPSDEIETVHSADTSDDYFIHFATRPINYYRNQLIFKISRIETVITEDLFPNFKRIIISKESFDEKDITDFLKHYHNGKQSAILAPESLYGKIQESFRKHFSQHGHFVFVTSIVEDVMNENRQDIIIIKEHERAHRGIKEVENQLRRSYFFPKMSNKIRSHINACNICNMHKYDRKPYNIKISARPITEKPLERVHIDIFSINKNSFLSVIDSFSKHLQMIPINSKNLIDINNALNKYFALFGIPNTIVSDHETTFQSAQFKEYLNKLNVKIEYASSSESNGQIEKTHATIIEIFNTNKGKLINPSTSAAIELSVALYNNSIHSATGYAPNEVIFNQNNLMNPVEIHSQASSIFQKVKDNLEITAKRMEKQNEKKEVPPELTENQVVFLKPNIRSKTQPRGLEAKVQNVDFKTFKINRNIKRNKSKLKRLKKIKIM